MNILRRYFLREFIKYFLIFLICFTAIAIIIEFFDKSPEFYEHNVSIPVILQYLLLQVPGFIIYALPFASLFSILLTIGMAGRWREVIVIKASGYSSRRLFSFFLIIGLILTLSSLILGESIVPLCTRKAMDIRRNKVLKQPRMIIHGERAMWVKGLNNSLIRIDGFIEDMNMILRMSIFEFDESFNLKRRIEADRAFWSNDQWVLINVRVFDFDRGDIMDYETYPSRSIDRPDIFREEIKKPREMNFFELYTYYSRLERAGFRNPKYVLRLYEKLAYPFINFIMILFGLALSLNTRLGGGIRAAGIGVLISVLYWLIYSMSVSLGTTEIFPPALAAWIAPGVFGISGGVLYLRIRD